MIEGKVIRINGPIIRASGLGASGLYDVVEIGDKRLIGEIIRLEGDTATIQIYEDNTGMRVGESAWSLERPLAVHLGPGLLGEIYDGIQRPLEEIKKTSGGYITPGLKIPPIPLEKKWHFTPSCKPGDATAPGTIIGQVKESATIMHRVVTPPDLPASTIEWIAAEGPLPFILSGWVAYAGEKDYLGGLRKGDQVAVASPVGPRTSIVIR